MIAALLFIIDEQERDTGRVHMDERMLANTAMLAGRILLVSGADIFRVEDTMNRILGLNHNKATAFVLATGITLTVKCEKETITLIERVEERATNLNRIYEVNCISRDLSSHRLDVEAAYERLLYVEQKIQYSEILRFISLVGVPLGFAILLGGDLMTCIASAIAGLSLAIVKEVLSGWNFNQFFRNAIYSFVITLTSHLLYKSIMPGIDFNTAIISSLMPMVPGVTFTTGVRDTFNGDYTSGMARILEAIVVALAVASGTGIAIFLVGGRM